MAGAGLVFRVVNRSEKKRGPDARTWSKETFMDYEQLLKLFRERRTIRAFKDDLVSAELIDKLLEAARWAPTGFNMQPCEFLVIRDLRLREAIKKIVDDYKNTDFFAMEETREEWQGSPWKIETHGRWNSPLAPVYLLVLGDTRRRVGLPMVARYSKEKGDSIFESSLSNAFIYILLSAQTLGLATQPISGVKYPKVQGLVKHLLNLPDFIYIYDIILVGWPAMEPSAKLMRSLNEMVHYDRSKVDEFMDEEALRNQIRKLRAGNVARHQEADKKNE
jgi:nitroreductase